MERCIGRGRRNRGIIGYFGMKSFYDELEEEYVELEGEAQREIAERNWERLIIEILIILTILGIIFII
jgi:hypothetical protein